MLGSAKSGGLEKRGAASAKPALEALLTAGRQPRPSWELGVGALETTWSSLGVAHIGLPQKTQGKDTGRAGARRATPAPCSQGQPVWTAAGSSVPIRLGREGRGLAQLSPPRGFTLCPLVSNRSGSPGCSPTQRHPVPCRGSVGTKASRRPTVCRFPSWHTASQNCPLHPTPRAQPASISQGSCCARRVATTAVHQPVRSALPAKPTPCQWVLSWCVFSRCCGAQCL